MGKFRKKPVTIEAVQFTGTGFADMVGPLPVWLDMAMQRCADEPGSVCANGDDGLVIHTLEGSMFADPGDWIICGTAGELYPCKPDIFAQIYEAVE